MKNRKKKKNHDLCGIVMLLRIMNIMYFSIFVMLSDAMIKYFVVVYVYFGVLVSATDT